MVFCLWIKINGHVRARLIVSKNEFDHSPERERLAAFEITLDAKAWQFESSPPPLNWANAFSTWFLVEKILTSYH